MPFLRCPVAGTMPQRIPTPALAGHGMQSAHVKEREYEARTHMEGRTDAEILRSEGADLPHATKAGNVTLPGGAHAVLGM